MEKLPICFTLRLCTYYIVSSRKNQYPFFVFSWPRFQRAFFLSRRPGVQPPYSPGFDSVTSYDTGFRQRFRYNSVFFQSPPSVGLLSLLRPSYHEKCKCKERAIPGQGIALGKHVFRSSLRSTSCYWYVCLVARFATIIFRENMRRFLHTPY